MNREHLGDAYDFWKRAMLDILRKSGRTLKILPMFTDDKWKEPEISVYKTLLGAGTHEIGLTEKFARSKGSSPFTDAKNAGKWSNHDLFLDPDTGVENKSKEPVKKGRKLSNKSKKSIRYLKHYELVNLLGDANVVAVYQHAPREENGWLKKKLADLRKELKKRLAGRQNDETSGKDHVKAVGYEAGRVGMIFVTKNETRAKEIERGLRKLAGSTARKRVFPRGNTPPMAVMVHWNGKDLPKELRALPEGRYVIESVDGDGGARVLEHSGPVTPRRALDRGEMPLK